MTEFRFSLKSRANDNARWFSLAQRQMDRGLRKCTAPLIALKLGTETKYPPAEIRAIMFTVYIDDSGTDPNQLVAVAAALIIPTKQIPSLESNWKAFGEKHKFSNFHS